MKEINYTQIIGNIDTMINALEYDSMRSAGKAKINASTLLELYELKAIYNKTISKPVKGKE